MKVISRVNTRKLVKGKEYDAIIVSVVNLTNSGYFKPGITIYINGLEHKCTITHFSNLDGSDLTSNFFTSTYRSKANYSILTDKIVKSLNKGDLVISKSSSKKIEKDKIYTISDMLYTENNVSTVSGVLRHYKRIESKIKVEGYNGWLSPYNFRLLSTQESREVSLLSIMDNKVSTELAGSGRVIDRDPKKKNRLILSSIFNAINDPYRNNMDIVDWYLSRIANKFDIKEDDINPYLDMKLSDIIKMLN